MISPEAIFLGGSVSQSYSFFKEGMKERLDSFPFKRVSSQLVIEPSEMANSSILGAAALAEMKLFFKKHSVPAVY